MKQVVTYLNFDGNCRQAMEFYNGCFGSEISIMDFSDIPGEKPPGAENMSDRVMHARLTKGGKEFLMASDTMQGSAYTVGTNFSVSVHCESVEEVESLFKALGEGGQVTMEVQDTFWGARFGMLKDKFGIDWMFNYEYPRA